MSRVLLLLPTATYRAPDFLSAAAAVGAEVVVASEQEQALASTMGARALRVDLCDPDAAAKAIVDHAATLPLDAVVAVDDEGTYVAARAAQALGLAHNPPEAVAAARNKAEMRKRLESARVRQPPYAVCGPDDNPSALARAVGLPVVVKATGLSASRGVIRADTPSEAAAAAERVRGIVSDPRAPLLVEGYVDGDEFAVEALLRSSELEVLAVFDKPDPLTGPYFEETIYVTPSRSSPATQDAVVGAVHDATAALGLREGPVHAEVRVDASGTVWLLEVAARSIGGLCSRTLRFGVGVSLEEVILRHALGLPVPDLRPTSSASGVMMLPIPSSGVLRAVEGRDEACAVEGISGLEVTVPVGAEVRRLPEGDRYLGFLFAVGRTPERVEAALREAHSRLRITIE